jgi:tRNA dimethylallyltransferase
VFKQIAIIGPTASGKSDVALQVAQEVGAFILSLDSLSIYKEIDIASAKPSRDELGRVRHFGIDVLAVDEPFDVVRFFALYQEAKEMAMREDKHLIIVGGSGFYLKMLQEGLSSYPTYSETTKMLTKRALVDRDRAYGMIKERDPEFAQKIAPADRYRIEKWLLLYYQSGQSMSDYTKAHPPQKIIDTLPIYEIEVTREVLRQRIALRTDSMIESGLIDEVVYLEKKYSRMPAPMHAIGLREVLAYLDGLCDRVSMREKIITNTARLAKRQQIFNKTQFDTKEFIKNNDFFKILRDF